MGARRGRGRAQATLSLIEEMIAIAREIQPCSVRAIHYPLFIRKLMPDMGEKSAKKVSRLCTIAREEGSIPWEWITDSSRAEQVVSTWSDPAAYARTVQQSYRRNKWQDQPIHVSVWTEKGTIEGTIRPVLDKYEVPFQVLHGWSGATPVWDMAQANLARHQRTRILYVGDRDPSGMYMSEVDLPRRLARYSTNTPADKDIDPGTVRRVLEAARLEIRRIALTEADTVALGPAMSFPASDKADKPDKKGDSRYKWFVENHGDRCWELDALSPNVLRDRLEAAIKAELDEERWDRFTHVQEVEREFIMETCQTWASISGPDHK
jgi:hypothetical protein